jgi:hypothetical protein
MSPFLFKADPAVIKAGLECGLYIAFGYVTQSIGLESTGQCHDGVYSAALSVLVAVLLSFHRALVHLP